jgi:hypothetical protein
MIVGDSSDTSVSPYLLHRIAGDLGSQSQGFGIGVLTNNYANDAMVISPTWNPDIALGGLDGDDTDPKPLQSFFTAVPLGWDFSTIWYMGANGYPALQ